MSCLNKNHILEIENLSITFTQYEKGTRQTELPVISNLNVSVHEGEIVAVVGASGSGKSLLAHAVLGLLPYNASVSGEIYFDGELLDQKRMEELRGHEIAFVPQSTNYLDPLMKVGEQVRQSSRDETVRKRQRRLFQRYGLSERVDELYPFECSGGMTRRVLMSSALMGDPRLIVADEPTPGMDLALAKKSLEDLRKFADEGKGVLLITHDIELAMEVADRIAVFYAGTTVEEAPVSDFQKEETLRHPYTRALWRALPQNGFQSIPGTQPYVKKMPKGCPFGPRCGNFSRECTGEIPVVRVGCGTVRCIKAGGVSLDDHGHHVHHHHSHTHGTFRHSHGDMKEHTHREESETL